MHALRQTTRSAPTALLALALAASGCSDRADAEGDQAAADVGESSAPAASETMRAADATGGEASTVSLHEGLSTDPSLTAFVRILETARLERELEKRGGVTIFAPNNAAFTGYPVDRVRGEANARAFVLRHTVPTRLSAEELRAREAVSPLEGEAITVDDREGTLVLAGDAHVLRSDLGFGDITVHVISRPVRR